MFKVHLNHVTIYEQAVISSAFLLLVSAYFQSGGLEVLSPLRSSLFPAITNGGNVLLNRPC